MQLQDLLKETLSGECDEVWENERTPTPVRRFGVRLHTAGLSIRETVAILDLLGIDRSHGAVWNRVHTLADAQSDPLTAAPSRVAVDEKQIEVDGEKSGSTPPSTPNRSCCSKLTCSAAAGPTPRRSRERSSRAAHQNTGRSEDGVPAQTHRETRFADTEFLVDAGGYLTALARHELSGRLDYRIRNHIEKWFQTVTMRIDRFHSFWRGSQRSAKEWLRRFRHHYNHERPNQALDGRTPAEEILN